MTTSRPAAFRGSNYDVRGLFRDVMNSQAYQRQMRPGEASALAAMHTKARSQVRKAMRRGVVVSEITTEAELRDYFALARATAARIRGRDLIAALPDSFFVSVFRTMVPRGQAVFLIARAEERPLAGALFLKSAERLTYYHGVSTRDPELAPSQGPSAIVWHAMRLARESGIGCFDHGAVSGKRILEVIFCGVEGKISDKQFIITHLLMFDKDQPCAPNCSRPSGFEPSTN